MKNVQIVIAIVHVGANLEPDQAVFLGISQRASALALIAFVLVLSVFGGWWQTKLVAWMGKTNALQSKNREQFYALLPDFCWLLLVLIVVVVMAFYLAEVLEIRWRRWFTKRLLARWFEHRAFISWS